MLNYQRRYRLPSFVLLLTLGLAACGPLATAPTPTPEAPEVARGRAIFGKPPASCATCHALAPETTLIGPSLAGIATRAAERQPGMDAREYIERSILRPADFLVPGYPDGMPRDIGKKLTSEQFNDLLAFLMTLR